MALAQSQLAQQLIKPKEAFKEFTNQTLKQGMELLDRMFECAQHEGNDDKALEGFNVYAASACGLVTKAKACQTGIDQVSAAYMAAGPQERKAMDVREDLTQAMDQAFEANPDHEHTAEWQAWCGATGQEVQVGDDDDLVISRGGEFKNKLCILTHKDIFELTEPVEDSQGYIWEKAAILEHIQKARGRAAENLAAGHGPITMDELKPARRVVRAAQQAKRRRAQEKDTGGAVDVL